MIPENLELQHQEPKDKARVFCPFLSALKKQSDLFVKKAKLHFIIIIIINYYWNDSKKSCVEKQQQLYCYKSDEIETFVYIRLFVYDYRINGHILIHLVTIITIYLINY